MKTMILTILVLLMLAFAVLPYAVEASGSHHEHETNTTVNNTTVYVSQPSMYTVTSYRYTGVALGIAKSQLLCDAGTRKNQVSVGVGQFDGSEAIAFGGCKSLDNFTLKGSIGWEDGKKGYGAGASWKF